MRGEIAEFGRGKSAEFLGEEEEEASLVVNPWDCK